MPGLDAHRALLHHGRVLPGPRARATLAAALAPLLTSLASCGQDADGPPSASVSTAPNGDVVSSTDVAFAQQLIPHHADALVMVDLTLGRALDPRVAALVERLREEHTAQVQTMDGWLTAWGEEVPATARDHASAHAEERGTGADHDDGLAALEQARGRAFEQALLTALVEHHENGIDLAAAQAEDGEFPPARELADEVVDTQEREVAEMRRLLEDLGA